jgi:hypothetical protein
MSALGHISRASFALFGLLAAFFFALPFLHVLARSYEGGGMLVTCFLFGGLFAVVSAVHFGCYRYARLKRGRQGIRAVIWFVILTSLFGFFALAARVIFLNTHRSNQRAGGKGGFAPLFHTERSCSALPQHYR